MRLNDYLTQGILMTLNFILFGWIMGIIMYVLQLIIILIIHHSIMKHLNSKQSKGRL